MASNDVPSSPSSGNPASNIDAPDSDMQALQSEHEDLATSRGGDTAALATVAPSPAPMSHRIVRPRAPDPHEEGRIHKRKPQHKTVDYSISLFDQRNARQIRQDEARIAARARLQELFAAQRHLVQYVLQRAEETLQEQERLAKMAQEQSQL
jgi:hypothetical protein